MKTMYKVTTGLALSASIVFGPAPQAARAQATDTTGSTQTAGPFQVTLIATPRVGLTRFEARIWRDGLAVKNARVTLNLAMPYHKHGATIRKLQSQTDLSAEFAQYAGTARLMEGTYEARVSVRAGDDKGVALYRFQARSRPAVAHLGMWHPAGGFEVRLTTDPESTTARTGKNSFRAQVTREGYPVTDAEVSINLTMPQMSKMGAAEDFAKLTAQDGIYVGSVTLQHRGEWRAEVTLKSGGKTVRTSYDFSAR